MSLKWADVLDIAIELSEQKPDVDPRYVNFVDLHRWVVSLPEFSDDPQRGERKCWRRYRLPGSKSSIETGAYGACPTLLTGTRV